MKYPSSVVLSRPYCVRESGLTPPDWAGGLLGPFALRSASPDLGDEAVSLEVALGGGFCLATVRVRNARQLDRNAFQQASAGAYRRLEAILREQSLTHPVRLWNHIPGIHDPMGDDQDRYMAFNAGRFEALAEWFGGPATFDTRSVSASGVGHDGDDLVVHCLAAEEPGRAVDNPRQVPPHRYSRRFGPLPPCFARATTIHPPGGVPLVLVGGTASIVGEESVHLGDLERQIDETLANLAVLLNVAAGEPAGVEDRAAVLARYRELRVYYPDPERLEELRRLLAGAFPGVEAVEWVRADLCRPELLVEIEGVAELGRIGQS
ncbi:MAG TPA: hypothetical protein VG477_14655 [Thermoanaerobaculia bacterium]|nr:hypothetical protein [Thermoanaerobaculia bacterium]